MPVRWFRGDDVFVGWLVVFSVLVKTELGRV